MFKGTKRNRYLLLLENRAKLADVEGELSRTFGVISKTPNRFCINRNLNNNGRNNCVRRRKNAHLIGHFRVAVNFIMKARLSVKAFHMKISFVCI